MNCQRATGHPLSKIKATAAEDLSRKTLPAEPDNKKFSFSTNKKQKENGKRNRTQTSATTCFFLSKISACLSVIALNSPKI